MTNALTVDLEDYYQGVIIPIECWNSFEKRLHIGTYKILNLLSQRNIKATFFVLGKTIEDYPTLIKNIIEEGHEIGCHTYHHLELYKMSPKEINNDIDKCKQLIAPFGISYVGFRAPYFSIDQRCLWVFKILEEQGFPFSSSVFPGDNKRTGIKNFPKQMHYVVGNLIEAPVSTFRFLSQDFGLGGAYFRMLPYKLFRRYFDGQNGIFYIHPWELDSHQPYISNLPYRIRIPHYLNLEKTETKLKELLNDFSFTTLSKKVSDYISSK